MFEAKYEIDIAVEGIPLQWLPKIEIYYPDLPQFPIMYIHKTLDEGRLIAFPVSVSFNIAAERFGTATFHVLSNLEATQSVYDSIKSEIEERIGLADKITKEVALQCCNGNQEYIDFFEDLWIYLAKSYGDSIPYGRFYEEVYSIARFVAAWQPKTGRQSEMRMLYNFMSIFGEEVCLPKNWKHLECYVIPNIHDVKHREFGDFDKFAVLHSAMQKTFDHEFTDTFKVGNQIFKVLKKAWKQDKDSFINTISKPLYENHILSFNEKLSLERLVDAFNRHSWRAAYFISSYMAIEKQYEDWTKDFFIEFYANGGGLKGYSEKVIACFLQQGFKKQEIIPIDTWIETFYSYPLGIASRTEFYNQFSMMGKLERLIWLSSQSNKTNMKTFFDLLWCQRYGTTGNRCLRGINPIACSECRLKGTCVGLNKEKDKKVLLLNDENRYTLTEDKIILNDTEMILADVKYICVLENKVPKKSFIKITKNRPRREEWILIDEFSGYILKEEDALPNEIVQRRVVTMEEFVGYD